MRLLFVIAFLVSGNIAWSQGHVSAIGDLWNIQRSDTSYKLHTAIQPRIRSIRSFERREITTSDEKDSLSAVRTALFNISSDLEMLVIPATWFRIRPVPDFAAQYDTSLFYRAAAGFSLEGQLNHKLYMRTSVATGWSTREGINQTHTFLLPLHNREEYIYTDIRARFAYTPNKMLHLATGIDNQFFGEGARSLLQGDQVAPNPFAMMRVNVWRLEYGLIYQFFNDNLATKRLWKFGATHYLSYNVTRNWNIGLFETVLFQPQDSTFQRGFEAEYLNPIVFFRPQEYSLGSSDNVLLGLQTSYTFKNHTLYGQLSLDEFDINEIRARSRWWANKYGAQLGLKGNISNRQSYRIEGNIIRPYTYSHLNEGQAYGNTGNPLGHPAGSNFAELLLEHHYSGRLVKIKSYGVFLLKGYDTDSISWGGDIYRSYTERAMEYGHRIGQGQTVRSVKLGCELGYIIPKLLWKAYVDPQLTCTWGDGGSRIYPAVTAGIRSELFGTRRRF